LTTSNLDNVMAAISDSTRRAIIGQLARGPARISDIATPFPMSLTGICKHVRVLERAGLITRTRSAQLRPSRLQGARLKDATEWLERYRPFWDERFDRLDARLEASRKGRQDG